MITHQNKYLQHLKPHNIYKAVSLFTGYNYAYQANKTMQFTKNNITRIYRSRDETIKTKRNNNC